MIIAMRRHGASRIPLENLPTSAAIFTVMSAIKTQGRIAIPSEIPQMFVKAISMIFVLRKLGHLEGALKRR